MWHPLCDDKHLTVMGSLKRTNEKKLMGLGTVLMVSQVPSFHTFGDLGWFSVKNDDCIGIEDEGKLRPFGLFHSQKVRARLFEKPISSGDVMNPARWEEHSPGQGQGLAVCGWIGEAAFPRPTVCATPRGKSKASSRCITPSLESLSQPQHALTEKQPGIRG